MLHLKSVLAGINMKLCKVPMITNKTKKANNAMKYTTAPAQTSKYDKLDPSFNNAKEAFKSKTNWELTRNILVYQICSINYIADNTLMFMKLARKTMGQTLFRMFMKLTFFGHFCAGEDEKEIKPVLIKMASFGVRSILDYSAEEDLSADDAQSRSIKSMTPAGGDKMQEDSIKKFHVEKDFTDRRKSVSAARTFFYVNEDSCEKNLDITLKCLEMVGAHENDGSGFAAIKVTGLGKPVFLLQLSEVIMKSRRYLSQIIGSKDEKSTVMEQHVTMEQLEKKFAEAKFDDSASVKKFLDQVTHDQEGVLHLFPWAAIINKDKTLNDTFMVPDLKTKKIVPLLSHLTKEEEEMFRNLISRIDTVCRKAKDLNLNLMVDAEQTYFQPAITRLTLEFMRKYNKERPIVYNTYQCYLKDTLHEITIDMEQAKRQNFSFGAKLVRGAYLEQERQRAATMNYPDPTCANFEATSKSYHDTLSEVVKRMKEFKDKGLKNKLVIFVASHNEDTVRFALKKMEELGVAPAEKLVCFGQLLGMCDNVSFPLGQAGYPAYKYVPFGPIDEVMPYLSRRATENRGILKKIKKEKRLLWSELFRRLQNGEINYTPKGNYKPI